MPSVQSTGSTNTVLLCSGGRTFGQGVELAVIRSALKIVSQDDSLFATVGEYRTLLFRQVQGAILSRQVRASTAGFLCLLHMVHACTGPEPISPFLLHLALDGKNNFYMYKPVVATFDQDTAKILDPWFTFDGDVKKLKESPSLKDLRLLLQTAGIQVRNCFSFSFNVRLDKHLYMWLVCSAAFDSIRGNPVV